MPTTTAPGGSRPDPGPEYRRRLEERRRTLATLSRIDARFSVARAITVLVGIGVAWAVFDPDRLALGWLALPLLAFVGLAVVHERVAGRIARVERSIAYYERGLQRIEDRWDGHGFDGTPFLRPEHPYAGDLDLFGKGSLYQRLCAARTAVGRSTLASWLLQAAEPREIRARQEAVRELARDLDLRESIAVIAGDVGGELHADELLRWARAGAVLPPRAARWIPPLLVTALIASLVGVFAGVTGRALVGLTFVAHAGFALWLRRRVDAVIASASGAGRELELLAGVLEIVEQREFESPRLRDAVDQLRSAGAPPAIVVRRLARLLVLLDSRRNQFFAPLAMLLLWGTQLAMAIEAWRAEHGPAIDRWVTSIGEFEALNSLGGYCYERPAEPFPSIGDDGASFRGEQVGHPLLPMHECVRNDVALGPGSRLLIVSGSNMSGKSTVMRAVGVNAVLALAGAPVRARRLEITPVQIGGTLRVQDSLRRGMSGFYAEIHRFRQLVELAEGPRPLLFLLEEILNTTNSHDRRVGADAVIRSLLERGSIGLVTTHDLAITEIAERIPGAHNVHFVDHLEGGEIRFDYVLRPGVVGKSNAVELMRSIGLDI